MRICVAALAMSESLVAFGIALLIGVVVTVATTARSLQLRAAWLTVRCGNGPMASGEPVAMEMLRWSEITAVAVQPVGVFRRPALVAFIAAGGQPQSTRRRRPSAGHRIVVARTGRAGIRAADLLPVLGRLSGGRLRTKTDADPARRTGG
jgi:hypothetical protein